MMVVTDVRFPTVGEIFQLLLQCRARFQSISRSWWSQMWAILDSWTEIFQLLLQCCARVQSISRSWWWQKWEIPDSWREIFQFQLQFWSRCQSISKRLQSVTISCILFAGHIIITPFHDIAIVYHSQRKMKLLCVTIIKLEFWCWCHSYYRFWVGYQLQEPQNWLPNQNVVLDIQWTTLFTVCVFLGEKYEPWFSKQAERLEIFQT